MAAPDWLALGLGNPGEEYEGTRHNIGFEVIDLLAERYGVKLTQRLPSLVYGRALVAGTETILGKPRTFMNLSGAAAREAARQWRLSPQQFIVILDDVALPLGRIRVRKRGSDGGHKGLRSVIEALGSQEIPRVRVGIGQPRGDGMVDYVLGRFSRSEWPLVAEAIERAADAVETIIRDGVEVAMNRFNPRGAG
ncbi:MAG: peptidyl-tRNA hydrolase [Candidatus Binatia bacterium]|nr:MAG: peptidyl-tRNA hydrolase [Candidatus Binatia bacterium]